MDSTSGAAHRAGTTSLFAIAAAVSLAACAHNAPKSAANPLSERPTSWSPGSSVGPRCLDLGLEDELLCRADKRLIEARKWGDDRAVACYDRKSKELRAAYRQVLAVRERLNSGDNDADRQRLDWADRAMVKDFGELEACNGPLDGEGDSVRVENTSEPDPFTDTGSNARPAL